MGLSSKRDRLSIEQHWQRGMLPAGSVVGFIGSVLRALNFYQCQHTPHCLAPSELLRGGQPSSCFTKTMTASRLWGCFHENGTNQVFSSKSSGKCKGLFLVFLIWLWNFAPQTSPACRAPFTSRRCTGVVGAAQLNLSKTWVNLNN